MTDCLKVSALRLEIPAFAGMTAWVRECSDFMNSRVIPTPYRQRMRNRVSMTLTRIARTDRPTSTSAM